MNDQDTMALVAVLDRIARALETLAIVDAISTIELSPPPMEFDGLPLGHPDESISFAARMANFEVSMQRAGMLKGEA